MPTLLNGLLMETGQLFLRYWKRLFAAAMILGVIVAVAQGFVGWETEQYEAKLRGKGAIEVQEDLTMLKTLERRQRNGDAAVADEIQTVRARLSAKLSMLAGERRTPLFLQEVGLSIALSWLITCVVTIAMCTLAILCSLQPEEELRIVIGAALRKTWPMIRLFAALLAVSLFWIPLVAIVLTRLRDIPLSEDATIIQSLIVCMGYVVFVLLGPRLTLAPVLLLQEQKSIRGTFAESLQTTRGYWGKLLGNLLVVFLGLTTTVMTGKWVLSHFVQADSITMSLLLSFSGMLSTGIFSLFLVRLTQTIQAYPQPSRSTEQETNPLPGIDLSAAATT